MTAYLKFDLRTTVVPQLQGKRIISAKLRYTISNSTADTVLYKLTSASWNEGTINWNTRFSLTAATIATGPGNRTGMREVVVTSAIAPRVGSIPTILIDTSANDEVQLYSSEFSSILNRPQLVVVYQ